MKGDRATQPRGKTPCVFRVRAGVSWAIALSFILDHRRQGRRDGDEAGGGGLPNYRVTTTQ